MGDIRNGTKWIKIVRIVYSFIMKSPSKIWTQFTNPFRSYCDFIFR
jgi:hypothetical protein